MPPTHDLRAALQDRPLYEDLYRRTVAVAESMLGDRLRQYTAGEGAATLMAELRELRDFLLESRPAPAGAGDEESLLAGLRAGIEQEFRKGGVGDDTALRHELTQEFARALWSALLQQMRLSAADGQVSRAGIVVSKAKEDQSWMDLYQVGLPYQLGPSELDAIVRDVLRQLRDEARGTTIRLPLGLQLEVAMLDRALDKRDEPAEPQQGFIFSMRKWLG
jgi:hypothetical protein